MQPGTTKGSPQIWIAPAVLLLIAGMAAARTLGTDQPADDTVGAIEGEAISVEGPLSVDTLNGRTQTVLRNGSDVRVKFGQARIELVEGGQLVICGPAHLSLLKSAGALTVALDSGIIRARVGREPALTIYTAQIQATLLPIGGSAQDALVGFDPNGDMCVRATSGALRLENQLTGQSIVVPSGGDVAVPNGQLKNLRNHSGKCSCEWQFNRALPAQPEPSTEISKPATPEEIGAKTSTVPTAVQNPAANDQPVYEVLMPPLSYDATAAAPNNHFDPAFILLVRRARVRPALIFHGRVEGEPVVAQNAGSPGKGQLDSEMQRTAPPPAPQKDNSLYGRVRAFFHRLFS